MTSDEKDAKGTERVLLPRRTAIKYSLWGIAGVMTALTALTAEKAHAGYGQCSIPGCSCRSYMGSADLCQNCGHQFGMHW